MNETKPTRLLFRFTLRDLFWLTLVVALVLALWVVKSPPTTGRFQLIHAQPGYGGRLFDTATGRLWVEEGAGWTEVYPPPSK